MSSKIKITIQYYNKSITLDLPSNRLIRTIREKAVSYFYPINQPFYMFYQNQDLTYVENKTIGDVFGVKNMVKVKLISFDDKENFPKDIFSNQPNKNCHECNEKKFLNYYCRDCNIFLCKDCRIQKRNRHYQHRIIQLFQENEIKKNIELYRQVLQNDLNILKNKVKKLQNLENNEVNSALWKKNLTEKIEKICQLIENKKEEIIKIENPIQDSKEVNEKIRNFKDSLFKEREESSISEDVINDPLIEFSQVNKFDNDLNNYKRTSDIQINNEKIREEIDDVFISIKNDFERVCNENNV
jgi:hypothetical protein